MDAIEQLGPAIAARSAEIEEARTLPLDIVRDLSGAGLFKLFVPRRHGGGECSPADGLRVTEALAWYDGSTAWCQMIAMTTGVLGGFLPSEQAKAIYRPADAITGGFAAPVAAATSVDGGLSVTGRWQWGSGIRHCTTIGGGVRLERGTAFAFFDPIDVEVLDTWHVTGLKGTGSTDYQVDGAFVADGRWVRLNVDPPVEDGPLYRFSFFGLLAIGVSSVALGLARRSIDELVDLAGHKTPQGSSRPLADRAPVQADIGAAEATLRASRALLDEVIGDSWATVVSGDRPSDEQRRAVRLAATHAAQSSAAVVDRMYTAAGGAAIFADNPLQRLLRDVHVVTQHAITAPRTMELVGRMKLGLETDTRQL